MRPFTFRRITDEDMKDAPKGAWKTNLEYALNLFWQQLYNGIQNGFTPEENMREQTVSFPLVGSSIAANNIYTFTTLFSYAPNFVEWWVVPTNGSVKTSAIEITGSYANNSFIITGIAGLITNVPYNITIRLWYPPQIPNK
jgi:hypothetical protein